MFNGCNFSDVDLSSFDTSQATNMTYMFKACDSLTYLDFRLVTFDKVTSCDRMFHTSFVGKIITKDETTKNWLEDKVADKETVVLA